MLFQIFSRMLFQIFSVIQRNSHNCDNPRRIAETPCPRVIVRSFVHDLARSRNARLRVYWEIRRKLEAKNLRRTFLFRIDCIPNKSVIKIRSMFFTRKFGELHKITNTLRQYKNI